MLFFDPIRHWVSTPDTFSARRISMSFLFSSSRRDYCSNLPIPHPRQWLVNPTRTVRILILTLSRYKQNKIGGLYSCFVRQNTNIFFYSKSKSQVVHILQSSLLPLYSTWRTAPTTPDDQHVTMQNKHSLASILRNAGTDRRGRNTTCESINETSLDEAHELKSTDCGKFSICWSTSL